jgi:predicted nucleotide-binding protein
MIECIEKKQDHAVTLLDAIWCIEKAWRRVTDRTIHNCFRHTGLLSAQGVNVTENEDDVEVEAATAAAADDLPLSKWVQKSDCDVLVHYEYDAYATVEDNDIVMTEAQTD